MTAYLYQDVKMNAGQWLGTKNAELAPGRGSPEVITPQRNNSGQPRSFDNLRVLKTKKILK
jgi:hypothetical protein